jgi:predicted RNA-binding protein YlqC (UPF0109 family)
MYKELVEYIIKCLVENKEEVQVTEKTQDDATVISIKVATTDMGRIIGKEGRIIKSVREIVRAYSAKEKVKVLVEIEE